MLLQIPLDIPDVKIEKFDASTKKGCVVTVTSEQKGTTCQHCGKPIDKFYGYSKEITLRHLPILEKPVWLKIKPKRYQCPYCDNGPTTHRRAVGMTVKARIPKPMSNGSCAT